MSDAFERAAERAEAEDRRRRRERVARGHRQAFRIHATVFVAVQVLLVVVWALVGAGYPWFLYALVGWGVGLAAHYAVVRDSLRGEPKPPAPAG
jgi:2TM domain-containing protein